VRKLAKSDSRIPNGRQISSAILRPLLVNWLTRYEAVVTLLDRGVIVLIVYASFCESSQAQVWSSYPQVSMALLFVITALLLLVVLVAAGRRTTTAT